MLGLRLVYSLLYLFHILYSTILYFLLVTFSALLYSVHNQLFVMYAVFIVQTLEHYRLFSLCTLVARQGFYLLFLVPRKLASLNSCTSRFNCNSPSIPNYCVQRIVSFLTLLMFQQYSLRIFIYYPHMLSPVFYASSVILVYASPYDLSMLYVLLE